MTDTPEKKAHIIVVSNEKGGTGKSTIAMHLAVKLMQEGFSVATIDLDGRQGSLSKYIENRKSFCEQKKIALPIPEELNQMTDEKAISPNLTMVLVGEDGSETVLSKSIAEASIITPVQPYRSARVVSNSDAP